jgi:TolB protein
MKYICLIILSIIISGCSNSKKNSASDIDPSDYVIAYNVAVNDSSGNSNYEIFTINPDGSGRKNITNNKDVAWTYRSFKNNLYFISDRDTCHRCFFLYRSDAKGEKLKKISELQLEDSWMDTWDGKQMVVSGRTKDSRFQLYIIDLQTGAYQAITNDTIASYKDPAFSPDGKQIAVVYKKNKRDKSIPDEVYLMNADGTGLKQLSNYPKEFASQPVPGYKAGALQWHPTENFISYISHQNGQHNIYAVATDGSWQRRLTNEKLSEGWHDWSDDGKWLVYDLSDKESTQYHIMLMNWQTNKSKQLTDTTFKYQYSPVFVSK